MDGSWVILKNSWTGGQKREIMRTIEGVNDRLFTITDESGVVMTFPTSDLALEKAVEMGLHRVMVANVPILQGDSMNGFFVEPGI